ncbi:uncharacterized protein K452DRAFT_287607 [Aplosporella prunicola CBS 121167]|uniref:Uncharacterized protein n=1 Tax=Aplosporella prunicola CBS 121167 TaxID=1176127 RepID=A0A6A6BFG3_9PEZI|nr:uncharacterized protein K452DRAFT_287607 [Aplosporella prunicola CBS 121167]KAF2141657.1 hypothetical protein K452DRAFT_287607 [Aplosporella prunicola CBS 121167]
MDDGRCRWENERWYARRHDYTHAHKGTGRVTRSERELLHVTRVTMAMTVWDGALGSA